MGGADKVMSFMRRGDKMLHPHKADQYRRLSVDNITAPAAKPPPPQNQPQPHSPHPRFLAWVPPCPNVLGYGMPFGPF